MSKMKMTKLSESRFHVHVADCFIDEDVNDPSYWAWRRVTQ